ncbi:hypothetical protein V7S43_002953 [Phytophthora oleae]|uniref:Uncharacterized protein n=1 Tax=Phytophthora oleae TaxID=2107226 RepID=A0ABD3G2Q7_9STRA
MRNMDHNEEALRNTPSVRNCLRQEQAQAAMITTEVAPCESNMLHSKLRVHDVPTTPDLSNYDNSCQVDKESRKELVRRGAVGRRCAVVGLPADILAAIAEISELKW